MIAARIANMERGDNQHASIDATSQAEAAKLLNVSRPSVQRARVVLSEGTPELIAAVDAGVTAETVRAWTEDDSTFRFLKVEGKDGKARPATYRPRAV